MICYSSKIFGGAVKCLLMEFTAANFDSIINNPYNSAADNYIYVGF